MKDEEEKEKRKVVNKVEEFMMHFTGTKTEERRKRKRFTGVSKER